MNANTEAEKTQTQRKPSEDTGRDWSYVAYERNAWSHQMVKEPERMLLQSL